MAIVHALKAIPSFEEEESHDSFEYLALLGRVKKALASAKQVAIAATDLRPFPNQPRKYFDPAGIRSISQSIALGGQTTRGLIRYQPGTVQYRIDARDPDLKPIAQPDGGVSNHELIDGERRWRGILLIPNSERPLYKADLIEADDEVVRFLISGVANFNRVGHTALELMQTIAQMRSFKLPMREIAALIGISEMWAYQIHGLRNLAPNVRTLLDPRLSKRKRLPIAAAIEISKMDMQYQRSLAERVISRDIPLTRLRDEIKKLAERIGAHIRIRESKPRKQWELTVSRVGVSLRSMDDARVLLQKQEIVRIIGARPHDAARLMKTLERVEEGVAACKQYLKAAMQ